MTLTFYLKNPWHSCVHTTRKINVFIATSLDGYIANKNGGIDWLHAIPNPANDDMGYVAFNKEVDALVMGRTTFETVLDFDVDCPYNKAVFALSTTLKEIPESHKDKAFLVKGEFTEIFEQIHEKGFNRLYVNGGTTIRNFLKEYLINEMVITTIPVLLGGVSSLFKELPNELKFEFIGTKKNSEPNNTASLQMEKVKYKIAILCIFNYLVLSYSRKYSQNL
ncbi:MAG: dihydrofolate reductase [Sediminicola sp.]